MNENKGNKPWSDEELRAALDAYLYMLQLELSSVPFSAERHSQTLLTGPLEGRSPGSVRYRMRNISAVIAGRNLPVITAFSPAEQVGRHVRTRLEYMLDARKDTLKAIKRLHSANSPPKTLQYVLRDLDELKVGLTDLENRKRAWLGHNNPPGKFDFLADELRSVSDAVEAIRAEIVSEKPDVERVGTLAEGLSSFGLKIWVWTGQRITDFSKAAAISAGGGFGLYISGLGEQVLMILRAVFQLFS